ncbi:MAG: hypothetical protein HC838_05220 [Spirulinaceae cyanobacterium RM2_2_10]|nr:hypothetical protein [Spirulinaceae cyanobacterium SM2_1_0]NJO19571.1 hypothetical protein [Spirulinaceae cyanobacterium RM2_2_10]
MAIVINLNLELESLLLSKATSSLEWEEQDLAEFIAGIQKGLEDFGAGRCRSFQEFAEEQLCKYQLSANS